MNKQNIIKTILATILFVALQVLFVRNLILFDVAFCFIYIIAILWLPGEMDTLWVIIISFLIGLGVDLFYNTSGVHAAACTLIGFLRKSLLQYFFPGKGIENEVVVSLPELGHQRYFLYICLFITIHHTFLFFVEAGGVNLFLLTLLKIGSSILFTTFIVYLVSVFSSNLARQKQ